MHRLQKLSRTFPTFAFSLHLHIVFFQHTQYVRLPIQRFARQRNERDNPLRPVVLQSAGSDMQYPAHVFPVRYTSPFIAGRKFAVTLSTYFILRSRASKYACTSSMSFVITSICQGLCHTAICSVPDYMIRCPRHRITTRSPRTCPHSF